MAVPILLQNQSRAIDLFVTCEHKTGNITRIHHDAAIVFAPRPYVLVLLVRGIDDQKKSAALMGELSRVIYEATER